MMNFIMMTVSFTIAILASGIIFTAAMITLMMSPKAMKWLLTKYMKLIEKSLSGFDEDLDEKLGA